MITNLSAVVLAVAVQATPATAPAQRGVTSAASTTVKGDPTTFDLAGFRLGMTESEVEAVVRARGMTVRNRTRTPNFDSRVRGSLNMHYNAGLPGRDVSELGDALLDDGKGGRINLRMLGWPGGARVAEVTFLVPPGTPPAGWRTLLEEKYGRGDLRDGSDGRTLIARWCARPDSCLDGFRLTAGVGVGGGTIELAQPDGMRLKLGEVVEAEVRRRVRPATPAL